MATRIWTLRRNCSLTPRQSLVAWAVPLMLLLAVAALAGLLGWWWVLGFALLTAGVLAAALWLYARHALDGETLRLADDGLLHIEQQCGLRRQHRVCQAALVKLETTRDGSLTLWTGHTPTRVGAQAVPARRERAARELRQALHRQHDRPGL